MQTDEDKRIAAMLLRNAREQVEQAKEDGNSAYRVDPRKGPGRVNERLLKGEVNQMKSFNKRAGVDCAKLPAMPESAQQSPLERERIALDREFVRRAHEMRTGGGAPLSSSTPTAATSRKADVPSEQDKERADVYKNFGSGRSRAPDFGWGGDRTRDNCRFSHDPADLAAGAGLGRSEQPPDPAQRKRQRIGAGGTTLDLAAATEEAARQADEDLEFANPLMRGPASKKTAAATTTPAEAAPIKKVATMPLVECWASKKLRVRIVDESGAFRSSHLKKGVIKRVDSSVAKADVQIEGDDGKLIRDVPQALLETVVSKACKQVEIVRGSSQGLLAELLQRDPKRNVAVVRLGRGNDCDEIKLPLDDVCEYV